MYMWTNNRRGTIISLLISESFNQLKFQNDNTAFTVMIGYHLQKITEKKMNTFYLCFYFYSMYWCILWFSICLANEAKKLLLYTWRIASINMLIYIKTELHKIIFWNSQISSFDSQMCPTVLVWWMHIISTNNSTIKLWNVGYSMLLGIEVVNINIINLELPSQVH